MVIFRWQECNSTYAAYVLASELLYLLGSFGVTIIFNMPRNDALATIVPSSADGAARWANYLVEWRRWNLLPSQRLPALSA
ncbi:MAG: anthrone oxygenase family protein [Pseudomonadota bacterium]